MRVLTVGNMYPPHHQGGYEQDWAAGVAALHAARHDVHVLVSDHREPGVSGPAEPRVFRELRWYWHAHGFPRRSLRERLAIERHNAAALERRIGDLRPDLISWWPMGGMSLSLIELVRRRGLPAIGVVYDDWMVYGRRADAWLAGWSRRRARLLAPLAARATGLPTSLRLADSARWLFGSESLRRAALEAEPGLRDAPILPPGLDEVFLTEAPARPDWRWELLAPSRLDPRKGLRTAVEALALLPDARLTIIGGGDERHRGELLELAAARGVADRVAIEPRRSRPALAAAYAGCDAVLFPVEWTEPFGLVPLEAMGIGRPVVATGRGGSAEFLRDGENCLLHARGDASSLARAVTRLADSPELRAHLREGGFATAPAYRRSLWNERIVAEHERCA